MSVKNPETMACPWWDKDKRGFGVSQREEYKGEKGGSNNGKVKDLKQPGKSYEQKQPEKNYELGYDKGYKSGYGSGYEHDYDHGHSKSSGSSKYGDGHSGQGKSKKTDVHYCPANDVYKYDY